MKSGEVTALLKELKRGNREAEEQLIPLVYAQLRKLAGHYLKNERTSHTLQATALVHEAYLRLTRLREMDWQDRGHFFALAAQVMRRVLVDYARANRARKRGGSREVLSIDAELSISKAQAEPLIALDEALVRLAERDPRQSRIVELRFFGGLTEEETGAILGISTRTVKRDWRIAKAWLHEEIDVRG